MICTGLPVVSWAYMPAAEMPMPCWPRLILQPVELRAVEELREDRRNLLADYPGPVVDHRHAEAGRLARQAAAVPVGRRDFHVDQDVGQDAGLLGRVQRVVDGFFDAGEEGLARVVEAEQVAVLGEELGDRDLPLPGSHLHGGGGRSTWRASRRDSWLQRPSGRLPVSCPSRLRALPWTWLWIWVRAWI